jgi:hypothetical protein
MAGRGTVQGWFFGSVVGALALLGSACAHGGAAKVQSSSIGSGGDSPVAQAAAIAEGRYAVESIRSRATIDGVDQLIEISEQGSKMKDRSGNEHTLTERGALTLGSDGGCQLALAVSVDGEAPGVSERACTWRVDGEHFYLGEQGAGTRTMYRVSRDGDRYVLEGVHDVAGDGKKLGDAKGERIVLVEGRGPMGSQPAAASESRADTESTAATVSAPTADEI